MPTSCCRPPSIPKDGAASLTWRAVSAGSARQVTPPGTARPDWMIAADLARHLGADLGARGLEQLWAEIEAVSPLHAGVSRALLTSRQGRNGVVVPRGLEMGPSELSEAPPPLDPMADPGIAQAEVLPAPSAPLAVAGPGVGRTNAPGMGPRNPAEGRTPRARRRWASTPARSPLLPKARWPVDAVAPPRLSPRSPSGQGASVRGTSGRGRSGAGLRLVTRRPMWDGGVLQQTSPSLASLHPPFALALHPEDLGRLGLNAGAAVRVSSERGSLAVAVVADPAVAPGTAVLPFNLPKGSAGALIDASLPWTEITVEALPD